MKNVIIYTRVSTEEQAKFGFSLNDQKQKLEDWCRSREFDIVKHFQDDYSAKTFVRPDFQKLLEYCLTHKKEVDYVLFLKWDRFSRNTMDAYNMIRKLHDLGIEANATEQWIDFENPDAKIMLAIYLAAPEVENDKISLRTKAGMRRAKKEGRWVGTPPFGYSCSRDELNKPIVKPNAKATIVQQAFELVSEGIHPIDTIRKKLIKKGYNRSKAQFYNMLRNPFYMGLIRIEEWRNEDEELVDGLHKGLIKQELFNRVQDVLTKKRKVMNRSNNYAESLPLRGFLVCPKCGRNLTGSRSRNATGNYYFYYHCHRILGCNESFSAKKTNQEFEALLSSFQFSKGISNLYKHVLEKMFDKRHLQQKTDLKQIESELKMINQKYEAATEKYVAEEITKEIYKSLEKKYLARLHELQCQKTDDIVLDKDFKKYMSFGMTLMQNLGLYYQNATVEAKQQFISLIFPEKLIFDNGEYRTGKINEALSWMINNSKGFKLSKQKQAAKNDDLSYKAPPAGLEPATYWLTANRSSQLS